MRLLTTSAVALIAAAGISASALAADVLDRAYDEKYSDQPAGVRVNWTGFYVGGAIGYGNANHDLTANEYHGAFCYDPPANQVSLPNFFDLHNADAIPPAGQGDGDGSIANLSSEFTSQDCLDQGGIPDVSIGSNQREVGSLDGLNSTGIVGDLRIGYDQHLGNRFLAGIFGTYGFSNMDADGSVAGIGSFDLERGDDWSVGARAGVLVNDSTLLYALAAYTQTEYELSLTGGADVLRKTTTFSGITVGGGVEFAVSRNVFLGLEGTHTFYDDETIFDTGASDVGGFGTNVNDDLSETKIMGTLKIKLNGGLY